MTPTGIDALAQEMERWSRAVIEYSERDKRSIDEGMPINGQSFAAESMFRTACSPDRVLQLTSALRDLMAERERLLEVLANLDVRLTKLKNTVHACNRPVLREGLRTEVRGDLGGILNTIRAALEVGE